MWITIVDNFFFIVNSHLTAKKIFSKTTYPLIHAPNNDSFFNFKFSFYYNYIDVFRFLIGKRETKICLNSAADAKPFLFKSGVV